MLTIVSLEEKLEYLEEVATLTQKEWGKPNLSPKEFQEKVERKMQKIKKSFGRKDYAKLILLQDSDLVGFISIFPTDGEERKDLTPWYATMFVKTEYRGKGYSKKLNHAILEEAKKRNFERIYLKTNLENYYEKFGAIYLEKLKTGEKLYYFDLS